MASVLAVLFKDHHPEWSENLMAYSFATPAVFRYMGLDKTRISTNIATSSSNHCVEPLYV